ncbi:MAG: ATP-dependent DNA helicase, partial [Candidatus Zipacnadales bacterium]
MTAYLQLEQRAERWWLGAARSSGLARVWDLGPGETPANHHVAPDLAEYLRTTDLIVTYSATTLVNWLSNPAVWGQTGVLLERLVDAQEVALFVAPTLRDYSLKAFCEAHHIPPPSTATSSTFRTQWETLSQRLRERTLSLPSAVRGLVASVAGDIWSEGLLGRRPVLPLLPGPALLGILSRRPHRGSGRPAAEVPNLQEAVVAALSPQGPVAQEHRAYEHRPGQIEMARSVAAAFEREELLLIEAGTGTGKSLAYLIPAILFARTTGMPVLISTNTKHLQDQLLQRDLPLANKALGVRFRAELVKGRSNYLCPRLLAAAVERVRKTAFREERLALAHLIAWAAQVEVAEVDALAPAAYEIAPALRQLVAQVRARNESCSGPKCSYFQNCPVEVVRARAQNANLVVVNHALLLASRETSILPECRHIVIDEAHNLEEVATAQLGYEISEASLRALVRLLE